MEGVDPLSLTEKVMRLMLVRIGSNLSPVVTASDDEGRILALVEKFPLGGLLLFNGVWPDVQASLKRLQQAARRPLLVAADFERGAGQQLSGLTVFPHAAAFTNLGDDAPNDVRRAAEITARESLAAGVQIVFAPVADANTNPQNPIIATRAYGQTPDATARLVEAAVQGIAAGGALATAKHFPGHGDTCQDSHAEIPTVPKSGEDLRACELVPFSAAISAGTPLLMTAHVGYPALDPTGTPATFSAPILRDLLRGELGYDGVICSDSLLMEGALGNFENEGEMAAAALQAGVDLLLDIANPEATANYLCERVRSGDLAEAAIDASLARIDRLHGMVGAAPSAAALNLSESQAFAASVARRSIVGYPDGAPMPRIDRQRPVTLALLRPYRLSTDPPLQRLAVELQRRHDQCTVFELVGEEDDPGIRACLDRAREGDQIVIAIVAKPAAWHAFGLSDRQRTLLNELLQAERVIVASLGVPTVLDALPRGTPAVCAYSDVDASQIALADALLGEPQ